MGHLRAAGLRQRNLRNGAEQLERIAPGERDFLVQGWGYPLGQTGGGTSGHAGYSSNGSASQHDGQPIRNGSVSQERPESGPVSPTFRRALRARSRTKSGYIRLQPTPRLSRRLIQ